MKKHESYLRFVVVVSAWLMMLAFCVSASADILLNNSFESPVLSIGSSSRAGAPTFWFSSTALMSSNCAGSGCQFPSLICPASPPTNAPWTYYPQARDGRQYVGIGVGCCFENFCQTFTIATAKVYNLEWFDSAPALPGNGDTSPYSVTLFNGTNQNSIITTALFDGYRNSTSWVERHMALDLGVGTYTIRFQGELGRRAGVAACIDNVSLGKAMPVLTWANPADIVYGTLLGVAQLNATAHAPGTFTNLPGTFSYDPPDGWKLHVVYELPQTLTVVFTPTDTVNYTTASTNVTIVVHRKDLTVTVEAQNKLYNGTNTAIVSPIPDKFPGDVLDFNYTAMFSDKNVGTNKLVTVDGIQLYPIGDYDNYNLVNTTARTNADITPAPLTIYINIPDKVYDGTTTATAILSDNRVGGDDLSDIYSSATFSDKKVSVGKTVTIIGITFTGPDSTNYTHFNNSGEVTGNITNRLITVKAATDSKVYDGTVSSVGLPTITSGGLVSGDSGAWTQTFNNKNVGTGKTLIPSGSITDGNGGNNYAVNFVNDTSGSVTSRSFTVTATGVNKVYDGTTAATVTLTDNRASGDNVLDNYVSATFSNKDVGTNIPVSVSGISINGSDANNYTLVNTNANTTANIVSQGSTSPPIIISVNPNRGPTNGGAMVSIVGTGFDNGATVAFGSQSGIAITFISSNMLTTVTPAAPAGAVNIVITNSDGQTSTLAGGYFYTNTMIGISSSNLVQDGGFEAPVVSGSYTYFYQGDTIQSAWLVESVDSHGFAVMNASDSYILSLFNPTPEGNQFGYSGNWVTVLRQDLATPLSTQNSYNISLRLSGFNSSPAGTVTASIYPFGLTNAVFTNIFYGFATNWVQQKTNFTVPTDGSYTLRLKCGGGGIVGLDDVSVSTVAAPVFQNIARASNSIVFTWSAFAGQTHQLQYKTNLNQPNWLNLGAPLTATNTTVSATDTLGPDPQRFYRVLVGP